MANVLVTGGAGFIGSHLVRALLARGDRVSVFDNFSTGKRENLRDIELDIEVIEGDIRDDGRINYAASGMDVIFHQAAFVSVPQSMQDPTLCNTVNVHGTENVLEAARRNGIKRVVLASSSAVYGNNQNLPLDENEPLAALSPYGASKHINEVQAGTYTRAFGVETVALRYFNVFGPRQNPDSEYAAVVPIFIRRALQAQMLTVYGDGAQTRDLVYVADVVRANLAASQAPGAAGRAFNVCTGQAITIRDLAAKIVELIPGAPGVQYAAPRAGDILHSVGSPRRAADALAFEARTPLVDGLREIIQWMQS